MNQLTGIICVYWVVVVMGTRYGYLVLGSGSNGYRIWLYHEMGSLLPWRDILSKERMGFYHINFTYHNDVTVIFHFVM